MERYSIAMDAMEPVPDGEWVRHEVAQQEIDALQRQVDELTAKLEATEGDRRKVMATSDELGRLNNIAEEDLYHAKRGNDTLRAQVQQLREVLSVSADFALAVYEPYSKDTIRIARERIKAALDATK